MTPPYVPAMIGMDCAMKGMHEEALGVLGKARELLSAEHTPAHQLADIIEAFYGIALAQSDRREEAHEVIAGLAKMAANAPG